MDYKAYHPSRSLTPRGKLLVGTLRWLYTIRRLLGFPQWKQPIPGHHEDPLKMNFREKLYLGYKYYFRAMVKDGKDGQLESHFKQQDLLPAVPADFIAQESITISAGGDLIPYTCITKENCENLWDEAGSFFFDNDLVFANLETVADMAQPASAAPEVMLADMYFNIHEETFKIFSGNGKFKGYDVLSTANNHTMDFGREGIVATQLFLSGKNIASTGTSLSEATRDDFPVIERKGIKIAFLGYTYSLNRETLPGEQEWLCNHLDLNVKNADISLIIHQAKLARQRGADIVVASLHMGCAYQVYPQQYTVDNMHRICRDAGIDILLGGHPHNIQPMERFETADPLTQELKQHYIIYSLGDFIAYDIFKWCHLPLVLKFKISKGNTGNKPATIITGFQAKPFYMYRDKTGKLKLVDFIKASGRIKETFPEKVIQKEVTELSDFFYRFILTKNQENILTQMP